MGSTSWMPVAAPAWSAPACATGHVVWSASICRLQCSSGAKSKNVYDELHQDDLVSFMLARPQAYDVVTGAASLIHFGDLGPAFTAAGSALRAGGAFVFTVFPSERNGDFSVASLEGFAKGGCFLHGRDYIAATASASGFGIETIDSAVHEYKNDSPVAGLVVVLRKP